MTFAARGKLQRLTLAGVVLLLLLSVCWKRLIFEKLIPVDGNTISLSYPDWKLSRSFLGERRIPFWNPYRNMGEPFLADPKTMSLYPVFWILSPLKNFLDFMRAWVVFHSLLAAVFMGLWIRRLHNDPFSAAAGMIITVFNGFFTAHVTMPVYFATASWLPAVLYFQSANSPVGLGVSMALLWLAGFPPFACLGVLAVLAISVSQGRQAFVRLVKGGIIAMMLCAVQWIPFLELMRHSVRPIFLSAAESLEYSLPPMQLLKEILVPQWSRLSPDVPGDPALMSFYVGTMTLLMSFWGVVRGARREAKWMLGTAAAFALSLGSHLPFYGRLGLFAFFRYPAHWLLLATTGLTLLCAAGIARLPNRLWKCVVLTTIAFDLVIFCQQDRVAWAKPGLLEDLPPLVKIVQDPSPLSRVYHTNLFMDALTSSKLGNEEDYVFMKDFLAPSYGTAFRVHELVSYQVLTLKRAARYQERLHREGPGSPLLSWAGVSTVVTYTGDPRRLSQSDAKVVRTKNARPPFFTKEDVSAEVQLLDQKPGRAEARVSTKKPCTLVYSEVSYPGWRVRVDGRAEKLGLFEDTFLSVSLPPGEHRVAFEFSSLSFWVGLALSGFSLAGLLLFWALASKKDVTAKLFEAP